jgi:hypothetical protein
MRSVLPLSALPLSALALAVALAPAHARAHRGSVKHLAVESTEGGARDDIGRWLARGITLRGEGGACRAVPGAISAIEDEPAGEAARIEVEIEYRCRAPSTGLVLRDETIFATDPQHESFVRIRFAGEDDPHVLRAGRQELALGEPPSIAALLVRFAALGAEHLASGYDHLLFLLSLVLGAGALARRESLRAALRDVAIVVTAFTVGHSVTLIAAALEVIALPSRVVESVIAGSIALVAALNVARPDARQGMPWLALGFGLVHGLGFSGVLGELGLPARARVLSLLAFNVGIELAQLAFVAVMVPPLAWLAGWRGYRDVVVRGGSIAIAIIALVWMIERATGR